MGTAIHHALERVLPEGLASSDLSLQALSSIEQAAAAAVEVLRQKRPDIMHERLQSLEKQRIAALLQAWLDIEQSRPPFVIAATEKPCETAIAGLPLRLRVDRIDRLQANRLMIIDYKTGSASTSKWRDVRPDDPQLLLYALLGDNGDIDAIAKASLKAGEMGFSGMSGNDTNIKGIKPISGEEGSDPGQLWADQKIRWHRRLEDLAQEFLNGDAQVLPHSEGSCQYCHLSDVCRIGERR
jgi:RecB family exonuclease